MDKLAGVDEYKKMNIWCPEVVPQREWFTADLFGRFDTKLSILQTLSNHSDPIKYPGNFHDW